MVQKNNKWNLSKERGEELAHKYIIEILNDSKNNTLSLSELIILLNQRTKHINLTHHSKKKPITVYIRCVYGSFINFLDLFHIYGIIKQPNDILVKLFDEMIEYNESFKPISKDWIIVDEEEFILL
jgi:hypothetical protein